MQERLYGRLKLLFLTSVWDLQFLSQHLCLQVEPACRLGPRRGREAMALLGNYWLLLCIYATSVL